MAVWVYRLGEPQGVGRLTEEQVRHRRLNWKFYRRAGRVEALESVDARGQPTRHALATFLGSLDPAGGKEQPCRFEFVRNEQGRLTTEVARDRKGDVLWSLHHDSSETGHYSDKNGYIRTASGTGAAYVQFSWSAEGFLQGTRYCDLHRKPQTGSGNIFGYRSELNAHGQEVRRTILGADGQPCLCPDGYAAIKITLDDLGNEKELIFLDAHDQPTVIRQGYDRKRMEYDSHGNLAEEAYFDGDRPALVKPGYTRLTADYKEGVARTTATRDERGNVIDKRFFDRAGKPVRNKHGVARIVSRHDDRGHITEQAYFGPDDKPIRHKYGNFKFLKKYDDRGNRIEAIYLDRDDKLTPIKDGYAVLTTKYNNQGYEIENALLDVNRQLVRAKALGYARVVAEPDARGNVLKFTFYDTRGNPTPSREGFAWSINQFDARGNRIERAFFDHQGKPTAGWHRELRTFDNWGRMIEIVYRDAEAAVSCSLLLVRSPVGNYNPAIQEQRTSPGLGLPGPVFCPGVSPCPERASALPVASNSALP